MPGVLAFVPKNHLNMFSHFNRTMVCDNQGDLFYINLNSHNHKMNLQGGPTKVKPTYNVGGNI